MRGRLGRTQLKEITICNVEKSFQNDLAVNRRVSAQSLVLSKCRNSIPEKERENNVRCSGLFPPQSKMLGRIFRGHEPSY